MTGGVMTIREYLHKRKNGHLPFWMNYAGFNLPYCKLCYPAGLGFAGKTLRPGRQTCGK